ncbi:PAS domain S-box protein [Pseudomonas sp. H11T01]|uniref:hybrid sensor histidine kinase/response regulator n=1 Tax=Pseudomonas sp. H11T01 TaxID=3402749 RepID=UPI003AC4AD97
MKHIERFNASLKDEGRYRLLIDAVTDYAIYMLDPDGFVSSWNSGAKRFKGYEEAEILGQHFSRFYTEEDRKSGLPERALKTAATEGRFEGEGWRVRKDGERFWSHFVIDPIRSPNGELLGFAKVTQDLTERKLAQESLKRSEEQFRILVQGVSDYALYMLDPSGVITNWNLGAQRIKGYLPEEVIGQHYSLFFSEEDREKGEPQRALETAVREGRFENQGWRIRKDGSRFWANVVIDVIRNERGELLGFAKITRDITDAVAAQRALDDAREALFQSQKMESIGRLTGGIAHDFNNLLMVVLGSLEIVRRRTKDDPKIIMLLDNAIKGAQRGVSLTQRMLAFARRQELKLETVDVTTLIRGMSELLQGSLGPTITVETRFPRVLKPVMADANQLELALLNLAVNSRDAMPEGGRILISAREEQVISNKDPLKPGSYIALSLTDDGEGMDETILARAAEPFFTTKGIGKGTGLGLPMAQGLAEQSGGRLFVKSKKGSGTTVELWLPVADAPELPAKITKPRPSPPTAINSLTVLVVDDDPLVLLSAVAMLEDLGHTVFYAESGARALEIISQDNTIDLVITDQAMPHMTGIQLADAIKAQWPTLPVLLATGFAEQMEIPVSWPRLSKPFNQEVLSLAVLEALTAL